MRMLPLSKQILEYLGECGGIDVDFGIEMDNIILIKILQSLWYEKNKDSKAYIDSAFFDIQRSMITTRRNITSQTSPLFHFRNTIEYYNFLRWAIYSIEIMKMNRECLSKFTETIEYLSRSIPDWDLDSWKWQCWNGVNACIMVQTIQWYRNFRDRLHIQQDVMTMLPHY